VKAYSQYSEEEAMRQFRLTLNQHIVNLGELGKRCRHNRKVMEMTQSLATALESVDTWSELSGSIMCMVAYQPGMFDDDVFDGKADFDPR